MLKFPQPTKLIAYKTKDRNSAAGTKKIKTFNEHSFNATNHR